MSRLWLTTCCGWLALAMVAQGQQSATDQTRSNQETTGSGSNQERGANQERPFSRVSTGQGETLNKRLATRVALGNQEEIALSKLALTQARNPRVKEFAQMMVNDHQQYLNKLRSEADALAMQPLSTQTTGQSDSQIRAASATERSSANDTADRAGADRGDPARQQDGARLQFIERQVAEQCLALTSQELQRDGAQHFDKAYIGQQVGAHVAMLAKLRTFQSHASGELASLFREGAAKTEEHLNQARAIMKDLAENRSGEDQNRPQ